MIVKASMVDGAAPACIDLVVFRVGGFRIGVDAAWVRASRPVSGEESDEAGVAMETRLGLPLSPSVSSPKGRLHLVFKGDVVDVVNGADWAASVDGPMELAPVPLEHIHPLPTLLAARSTLRGLRGLALDGDGVVLLVDPRMILASDEEELGVAEGIF